MILFKLLSRQIVSEINGCISTGKEANVYHATTKTGGERAIKVILVSKEFSIQLSESLQETAAMFITSRVSVRGNRIGPVCVCVCVCMCVCVFNSALSRLNRLMYGRYEKNLTV